MKRAKGRKVKGARARERVARRTRRAGGAQGANALRAARARAARRDGQAGSPELTMAGSPLAFSATSNGRVCGSGGRLPHIAAHSATRSDRPR